jgi:hypothetical protein
MFNPKHSATEINVLDENLDLIPGQPETAINQAASEVDAETEAKQERGEAREERVHELLLKLKQAKAEKDDKAGKKIRRQLRKLGYYISKQTKAE